MFDWQKVDASQTNNKKMICHARRVSESFQVCLKAFTSASMYIQWGFSIKTPHRKVQEDISILEHEQAILRFF
jgi:hypothetical protein